MKLFDIKSFSLEELNNGQAINEVELRFICKIKDYNYFDLLKYEDHEQYQYTSIQNDYKVTERIRKTTYDTRTSTGSGSDINRTTKSSRSDSNVSSSNNRSITSDKRQYSEQIEVCIPTTQDGLNQFKKLCKDVMVKRRYFKTFKIPSIDYEFTAEFDLTPTDKGYENYCRLEVELSKEVLLLNLDINSLIEDYFKNDFLELFNQKNCTNEQSKLIDYLYSHVFTKQI